MYPLRHTVLKYSRPSLNFANFHSGTIFTPGSPFSHNQTKPDAREGFVEVGTAGTFTSKMKDVGPANNESVHSGCDIWKLDDVRKDCLEDCGSKSARWS